MHELMVRLEATREELKVSKRTFAIEYLDITEDTYSNWLRSFPVRPTNRAIEKISEVLEMNTDETRHLV